MHAKWGLPLLTAILLSSCARNAILREDATALSADMASVQAQASAFYGKQTKARLDFLLRVIANSPGCAYQFPLYVVTAQGPQNLEVRCATDLEKKQINETGKLADGRFYQFDLPSDRDYAALKLVGVLAEYQAVLARIVEDPEFDAASDLTVLADRVSQLKGKYDELAGNSGSGESASAGALYADEIKAVGALIDLVRQAQHDRITIDKVRKHLLEQGPALEAALASLSNRYRNNDANVLQSLELHSRYSREREFNAALRTLKDPAQRYGKLVEYSDKHGAALDSLTRTDPLATALDGLMKTHVDFRNAVLNNQLTDKQRQRIAKKTFQDLKAWFNAVRQVSAIL